MANVFWGTTPVGQLADDQLKTILQSLKRLGELGRRAFDWAFAESLDGAHQLVRPYLQGGKAALRDQTKWKDFLDGPYFDLLLAEAARRELNWDCAPPLDQEFDLSQRGHLERQVVGAIRDAINAHGPIVNGNAHSAAKRVIGAIKTFNRKVRACESP